MRILFHLLDAGVGGGQKVAGDVAAELVRRGHDPGLLVPGPGPAVEIFRALDAAVDFVDLGSLRRPRGVPRAVRLAAGYDLLYSHTAAPGQILGAAAARLARRPHVVHQHTYPYFSPRAAVGSVQRRLYRRVLRTARFMAVADHVRSGLEELGIPGERIAVVPNGVAVPNPPSEDHRDPHLTVGMLGRFDPGKGMQTFVGAARASTSDGVRYVIAGVPGPFEEHERLIRRAAGAAGVEVVEGAWGRTFLAELDVVVMPSRYEGSPLGLLEAMALGKAVVASDIPGIREVVAPAEAGILVPPDDAEALTRAIDRLARDPELRAALGRRARERVAAEYPLDRSLARIVSILETETGSH